MLGFTLDNTAPGPTVLLGRTMSRKTVVRHISSRNAIKSTSEKRLSSLVQCPPLEQSARRTNITITRWILPRKVLLRNEHTPQCAYRQQQQQQADDKWLSENKRGGCSNRHICIENKSRLHLSRVAALQVLLPIKPENAICACGEKTVYAVTDQLLPLKHFITMIWKTVSGHDWLLCSSASHRLYFKPVVL